MALLISTNHIYDKQLQKVLDNVIDLVQVKSSDTQLDVVNEPVTSSFVDGEILYNLTEQVEDFRITWAGEESIDGEVIYKRLLAYCSIQGYRLEVANFPVKIDATNKYVETLNDFTVEVIADVETGTVRSTLVNLQNGEFSPPTFSKTSDERKTFLSFVTVETITATASGSTVAPVAELSKEDAEKSLSYTSDFSQFYANFGCLVGTKRYNFKGEDVLEGDELTGTYEYIVPIQAKITLNGTVLKLVPVENVNSFGDETSKNAFILENNELIQKENWIYELDESQTGGTYTDYISTFSTILDEYKNGKQVVTLLCDIGDYYYFDESNEETYKGGLAISPKYGSFLIEENEIVVPMKLTASGREAPLSLNEDGTAMQFRVVKRKTIFDGAVWQELTLQQI